MGAQGAKVTARVRIPEGPPNPASVTAQLEFHSTSRALNLAGSRGASPQTGALKKEPETLVGTHG